MLDYAYTHLAPAVNARCDAAGLTRPALSRLVYHQAVDARVDPGPDGWTTADGTPGTPLANARYRDTDGNRQRATAEALWLDLNADEVYTPGEPLVGGTAAPAADAYGQPLPGRLCFADTNTNGSWDPGEDVWSESREADRRDMATLANALYGAIGQFVNHLEEPNWNGGTEFARPWTTADLLAALGQERLLGLPWSLPDSFAARGLAAWLEQAVAIVELLQVRRGPEWRLSRQIRTALAHRGPYHQVLCTWQAWGGAVCSEVLTLEPTGGSYGPYLVDPPRMHRFVGDGACQEGYYPVIERCTEWEPYPQPQAYGFSLRSEYSGSDTWLLHTDGPSYRPWYLGTYQGHSMYGVPASWATVSALSPTQNVFSVYHSVGPGPEVDWAVLPLPSSESVATLFAAEWAAAEWQPYDGGELHAWRWESDTSGYWPDGHDTCIAQMVVQTVASTTVPPGPSVDVYLEVLHKSGAPDLFPGTEPGEYCFDRALPGGPGGPLEIVYSPAVPAVPDPVFPGGENDGERAGTFCVHSVLKYSALPGFGPLPRPIPGLTPPGLPLAAGGPDTNRDDLVDVGADLVSFGPDSGEIALGPEWRHPQVMLPLAVALWDELPVHAYLCQGGFDDRPETAWTHPDAGPLWFAYSLRTRAYLERLVSTAATHTKIAEVVRPRGNRVAFEFAWDAAAGAFSPLGFPLAPNGRRTYVLRDLTPGDDLDASFELAFDSGVTHVFSGGSLADGTLARVRHSDGRSVAAGGFTDSSLNLNANTFVSPGCNGTLVWSRGRLARLEYTRRCGSGTLAVDLLYAVTPAGPWVARLTKPIPELSVSHLGSFGFGTGAQTVAYGSGVTVVRSGGSVTVSRPGGGAVQQVTTLNADGLPTCIQVFANGTSHATQFAYSGGSGRHPANGAAAWARLLRISHPDGSWERFEYDPDTGWPSAHGTPFGNAAPGDPDSACRVTRFSYDSALSDGLAASPAELVERPRRGVTETLGIETAREYHAYGTGTGTDTRRFVRTRRCVTPGAAWNAADNLEYTTRFNRFCDPDTESPAESVRHVAESPRADRMRVHGIHSNGLVTVRIVDARGTVHVLWTAREPERSPGTPPEWYPDLLPYMYVRWLVDSHRRADPLGYFAILSQWYSGIDPFGRIVRTDYQDGTSEEFFDLQWHGGALRQRRRDGSQATCTYFADGSLRSIAHYGVTTSFQYDDLGLLSREQRSGGALSVFTRTLHDSQGRQVRFEDELGNLTLTTYGGPHRHVLYPDGSRLDEYRFLDGTLERVSGSAVAETRHEYGVDPADGAWACTRQRSPAGFTDRSYAYTDLLGRTRQTTRSLGSGSPATMSSTAFDEAGRPCRETDADGVTSLTGYNARNEVASSALDLDADGDADAADRLTGFHREALYATVPDGSGDTLACVRTTVNGPADGQTTETWASGDGLAQWTVANGRLTLTRTRLGPGPGERTVTTTFPDGTREVEEYAEALLRRRELRDADGLETASETCEYDALRRLVRTVDGRTGVATELLLDDAGQVREVSRFDSTATTQYDYDDLGRLVRLRQPGGGTVDYEYDSAGRLVRESGAGMLPRRYQYDPRGLCTGMWTFQGGLDGSGPAFTEWVYSDHSGRLRERRLNGLAVEQYGYTPAGRLDHIVHLLPTGNQTVSFSRDAAGQVTGISHAKSSGSVSTDFDRAGRIARVTDATGTREFTRDAEGRILAETLPQVPGGRLLSTYDSAGRRTALTLDLNGTALLTWTWAYDDAGRLESVTDGHCSARYEYLEGANLVANTVCSGPDGEDRLTLGRTWDTHGRPESIAAWAPDGSGSLLASWQYTLDDDGRRTAVETLLADPADSATPRACRWLYTYDSLGQLLTATGTDPGTGNLLPGRDFAFGHDTIANRSDAGRVDPLSGTGEEHYTVNDWNQYTVRSVPGAVYITGMADPAATVSVDGVPAQRSGAAFCVRLPVNNKYAPVALTATLRAVLWSAAEGQDLISETPLALTVPAGTEALATAGRGALAADSRYACEWDADDRLAAVEQTLAPPGQSRTRLEFAYDWQGRRTAKRVLVWDSSTSAFIPRLSSLFIWDGWTLLAEFSVQPAGPGPKSSAFSSPPSAFSLQPSALSLHRSYLWGLDLDGLRSGRPGEVAGGVGGLLAVTEWTAAPTAPESTLLAVADAQGNVAALVDAGTDAERDLLETTEYEPFGQVLARTRADAGAVPAAEPSRCPFGFSTKYTDPETALVYFGYRHYRPDLGRWLSRDPLREPGGPNLYAYCQNDPINQIDPLGEAGYFFDGTGNDRDRLGAQTNVSILESLYLGHTVYVRGVGTGGFLDRGPVGGLAGAGGQIRLDDMYWALVDIYNSGDTTIDIFGFSRGAALARAFANMVATRGIPIRGQYETWLDRAGRAHRGTKVVYPRIRFLGIFDTVASFGLPGNSINWGFPTPYDLRIPESVQLTAHATARDDMRGMFPLTSIYALDEAIDLSRKVERSFPGAHADVGGGLKSYPQASYAPLRWMWEQGNGLTAGGMFAPLPQHISDFLSKPPGNRSPVFIHDPRISESTTRLDWKYMTDWWREPADRGLLWMEQ
jgi:RHS repeat-associated protein